MSAWTDAITDARQAKAKYLYQQMQKVGWERLSTNDRTVMCLLGWFCMEEDDSGEPLQFIEAELPRYEL